MAERRQVAESELGQIGNIAQKVPIPVVQAAGAALSIIGSAVTAADQKAANQRTDSSNRVEDTQMMGQKVAEVESADALANRKKNQGTVLGNAQGGKLSPREIYMKNKLAAGGDPVESPLDTQVPIKPEKQVSAPMDFTKGYSNTNTGVRNESASTLDVVAANAGNIMNAANQFQGDSEKLGDGDVSQGMFKNMNTLESQQKLNPTMGAAPQTSMVSPDAPFAENFTMPAAKEASPSLPQPKPDGSGMSNTEIMGEVMPKEAGGHIKGKGDGSGTDDAIGTTLADAGGYVIPKTAVPQMKEDGVANAAGHSAGQTANVNKTSDSNANAMVSSGEYYFTEKEAQDLTKKGINLDRYAPNADTKMNAATGGWLNNLGDFLSKKTSEGFNQRKYNEVVKDYRGEVPEGTVYDRDDPESIPSIKDWYQQESEYFNPTYGDGVGFNRQEFKEAGMDLNEVAEEYNNWMQEDRQNTYRDHGKEPKIDNGVLTETEPSKTEPSKAVASSGGPGSALINDLQDFNTRQENLWDAITGIKVGAEAAKFAANDATTFKGPAPQKITGGDYPMPSMTGSKNLLDQTMGKGTTGRGTDKFADSSLNILQYNASRADELDKTRTALGQIIDKQDSAKLDRHKEEIAIKTANADLAAKNDQMNAYLSEQFLQKKGEAMSQNIDAALDAVGSNTETKANIKESEINLRSALETQNTFYAGQAYSALMVEFGDDFPAEWAGQAGMNLFMQSYWNPEFQAQIEETRKGLNKEAPKPDAPPAESNND